MTPNQSVHIKFIVKPLTKSGTPKDRPLYDNMKRFEAVRRYGTYPTSKSVFPI